jgi:tetratricopeptide (TPR) repeat protein
MAPLDSPDIGHMTQFLYGEKLPPELSDYLRSVTGGNPLFLIELVRDAMSQFPGIPLSDSIRLLPASRSFIDIIREQLLRLNRSERSLVNTAAVFGDYVDASLLSEVSGLSPEAVAETLEGLDKDHHLLRPITWEKRLVYTFSFENIRETVENSLHPSRKSLLHEQVARALVKIYGDSGYDQTRISVHYEKAGMISQAIQYRVKAAIFAWQTQFPEESYAQLEKAENLLVQQGQKASVEDIYSVYSLWGEQAIERIDQQSIQRVFSRLYQAGKERHSPQLAGAGLSGLAFLQAMNGEFDTALQTMDRAQAFLEQTGCVYDQMVACIRRASIYMFVSSYQQAQVWYLKALDMDKNDGEPAQNLLARIQAKVELAFLYCLCGQPAVGLEISQEAYRSSELAFHSFGCLSANTISAMALYYLGRYQDVVRLYHENIDAARKMRNGRAMLYLHLVYARAALAMGRLGECINQLKTIEEVGKQIHIAEINTTAHAVYGEMLVNLGEFSLAEKEFIAGSSAAQNSFDVLDNRLWLGMVNRYAGNALEGDRIYSDALQAARQENMLSLALPAEVLDAIWNIRNGKQAEAQLQVETLEQKVQECELIAARLLFLQAKCMLAEYRQDAGQARSLAEQLAEQAAASQHAWMELQAWIQLRQFADSQAEQQLQENRIKDILAGMVDGNNDVLLAELVEKFSQKITSGWDG